MYAYVATPEDVRVFRAHTNYGAATLFAVDEYNASDLSVAFAPYYTPATNIGIYNQSHYVGQYAYAGGITFPRNVNGQSCALRDPVTGRSIGWDRTKCNTVTRIKRVNIHINPPALNQSAHFQQNPTSFLRYVVLHELGHAVGEEHIDGGCNTTVMNQVSLNCLPYDELQGTDYNLLNLHY